MARSHQFRIVARFGPAEVLRALEIICAHPNQQQYHPSFEFDWLARKLIIMAATPEGLAACRNEFEGQIQKLAKPEELFLFGKIRPAPDSSQMELPIGVLMQDAATYGELIGRNLVELGVRGIRVADQMSTCQINVQLGPFTGGVDFQSFIRQFPLPAYFELYDDGEQEMPTKTIRQVVAARIKNSRKKKKRK
ncbi:MAG: hypothetical protein ACFCU1_14065 [Sumerlaeia bacterium]